ncbi:flagellar motor protein MotB [Xanthomonas hyacinthi]|uniref:Flagellar motor protein MotB n=1 Tax=Xanthomonas hyacinthi TaxID=56455 RepID=A0A2S7EYE9_9XANT|nr:substrate-binding domain-containing protein [Xanthomonas hyacinthi]KLD80122.1 flagellar motor protein MotB [Xanthomonas hyacinthi DSM 19077]PPU98188.1 flagellar motor protein MotB [Xanthomonas hyacinthi]QGY76763.1 flagellar motor protein MotB [Xanthomonas hyacinthi]
MSRFILRLLLAGAAALCAIPSAAAQQAERLRVHGSNSIGAQLMPALVESWLHSIGYRQIQRRRVDAATLEISALRDDAPLVVEIGSAGSAAGFADLVRGDAELAMLARAPDARERDAAWQLGDLSSPDQNFVVALDGARVLVAADNPLASLSVAQLRDILSGRLTRWSQLGGADLPIEVQRNAERSGLGDFLRERLPLPATAQAASQRLHSNLVGTAQAVAGHPAALAVVALTTPLPAGTRALAIADGGIAVLPTPASIRGEDYPLVQRYSLYGGQMMSALGRSLALYSVAAQAQQVVGRIGPIPMRIAPDPMPQAHASGDTRQADDAYLQAGAGAQRLTTTLRFSLQSLNSMFEARSAQDLDRLIAFMHQPAMRGRALAVIGFATPDTANRLYPTIASNDRADVIAAYLSQRGIVVERARGLGAARPLVGGEDTPAKLRNERVEIWLLDAGR